MNLIIANSSHVQWHTDMAAVMRWLGNPAADFDWLITDREGGWFDIPATCLLSGEEFSQRLQGPARYFEFAVFSALPRGFKPSADQLPFADGNPDLWHGKARVQLPGALFEIVAFDSTYTLFIGLPEHLERQLIAAIPDIQPLDTFMG